jgi:hypothetical protein
VRKPRRVGGATRPGRIRTRTSSAGSDPQFPSLGRKTRRADPDARVRPPPRLQACWREKAAGAKAAGAKAAGARKCWREKASASVPPVSLPGPGAPLLGGSSLRQAGCGRFRDSDVHCWQRSIISESGSKKPVCGRFAPGFVRPSQRLRLPVLAAIRNFRVWVEQPGVRQCKFAPGCVRPIWGRAVWQIGRTACPLVGSSFGQTEMIGEASLFGCFMGVPGV